MLSFLYIEGMHHKSNPKNLNKKRILAFGEVLWDLLPSGKILGGAPFNFAFRMHSLGYDIRLVSRVGNDELGEEVLERMAHLKMNPSLIQRDDSYPTGMVHVTLTGAQPDFQIAENVAYDHIVLSNNLIQAVSTTDCFYFGTLIQRSNKSSTTLRRLVESSTEKLFFLDLNLRKSCFSRETVDYSLNHATILKLNDEEVDAISQMLSISKASIHNFCQQIMSRYALDVCLVTMGDKGVFGISKENAVYSPGYRVAVVDTIGAGDAFAAGFLHKWLEAQDLKSACNLGNALGALIAMQQGGTQPITITEIQDMLDSDRLRIVEPVLAPYIEM